MHAAFVINDISFNVFAANSEAVTGQQWNIPHHFWCQSSELLERNRAVGEITALLNIFNFVSIYQQAHALWPSTPETMVVPFRYQHITMMTSAVKSNLVSYIPSVSWFLRVIVQGKTSRMWHRRKILTVQLEFGPRYFTSKSVEKSLFLKFPRVVQR